MEKRNSIAFNPQYTAKFHFNEITKNWQVTFATFKHFSGAVRNQNEAGKRTTLHTEIKLSHLSTS